MLRVAVPALIVKTTAIANWTRAHSAVSRVRSVSFSASRNRFKASAYSMRFSAAQAASSSALTASAFFAGTAALSLVGGSEG